MIENISSDTISRQAAIKAIKEDKIDLTNPYAVKVFKATGNFEKVETQVMTCDRHIEILRDLPSAQPELIEQAAYIKGFEQGKTQGKLDAQLERKKGKWILTKDDDYEYCTCSECGYQNGESWMNYSDIPFCANCGADMRGK